MSKNLWKILEKAALAKRLGSNHLLERRFWIMEFCISFNG